MNLDKIKKDDLVKVLWIDAFHKTGWWNVDDVNENLNICKTIESVGYVVFKGKNFLIIAQSKNIGDKDLMDYCTIHGIPLGVIEKINTIK